MRKVALVTGGTRGIGLGITRHLADLGYNLALNGVREELKIKHVLQEISQIGVEVIYCQGDLGIKSDRIRIVEVIRDRFGRLDVLVNNAGIAPRERKDILETTESSFDEVLNINLKGPYFLTQSVANWMISQKKVDVRFDGCIINVSSISATVASVNRGEYCISKAGLAMMSKLFAVRLGAYDIPVFEVRPGVIETDMTSGVKEKYDNLIENGLCVQKRWGTPDDVGKVVSALVNNSFPYSTGDVFMVDGGLTISRL
jgi:NAD(P)-dependent dehydrogenase (short-subunit alcohol dehydrogenase family)